MGSATKAFKGMQMGHVMVQDYYKSCPQNDYARGYILVCYMMTPVTYGLLSGLSYGHEFKDFLHNYSRTAAWWAHAESLPDARNTVTLDDNLLAPTGQLADGFFVCKSLP